MNRTHGWQLRLMQYVADRARNPVDPKAPVCADFAAGALEAMIDGPLPFEWRGRYPTAVAGLRALRRHGFADHIALAASLLEEIPPSFAAPGDLAVLAVPDDPVPALGIVQGARIYVQSHNGVGAVPLTMAIRAFRVA